MRRHRHLTAVGLTVTAVAAAMAAVALTAPVASADVAGPYFVTQNNGSDPHVIRCDDPSTNPPTPGWCLYTTQDMGQAFAYPPANYYPMRDIRVYFATHPGGSWVDKGVAFRESQLDSWVPRRNCRGGANDNPASGDTIGNCRAYHLWAPSAVRVGNDYYLYVPDVSDTDDSGTPNIHTSSRIAVARSTGSPFGQFVYQGTVPFSSGYMSDPDVVVDGSNRYLIWANGDYSNCGGFGSAKLEPDMRTITSNTTQTVTINGLSVLGSCQGTGRPYVEGASLYKQSFNPTRAWTLIFAAKPEVIPTQCASGVGGNNSTNSVIAWASSDSAQGPFAYEGILMCGSTTEWTNQATITDTPNGDLIIIYHDGPANKQRKLHAECLFKGTVGVGGVYRQQAGAFGGFYDCMNGNTNGYWGLWGRDPQFLSLPPIIWAPANGGSMDAQRYAVGPHERYLRMTAPGNTYSFVALSNQGLVCTSGVSSPLAATCSSTSDTKAQFVQESIPNAYGKFYLKSVHTGRYVGIASDGRLYASVLNSDKGANAATFDWLNSAS